MTYSEALKWKEENNKLIGSRIMGSVPVINSQKKDIHKQ